MAVKTREEWLTAAMERLWPRLEKHGTIPATVRVICSWPTRNIRRVIGECYLPVWTQDGSTYITVSPALSKPDHVLHTLLHEMVHAIGVKGHGKKFKRVAEAAGLMNEGKDNEVLGDDSLHPELVIEFNKVVEELGPYPHEPLVPPEKKKGEAKKKAYVRCVSSQDSNYKLYIKAELVESVGAPICPLTNKPMEVIKDEEEDGE